METGRCIYQHLHNTLIGNGMAQSKNVIFWGAGATKALGIRATEDQAKFIRRITGQQDKPQPLKDRVAEALQKDGAECWGVSALFDLITILGDRGDNYKSIGDIDDGEREAMRRNLPAPSDKDIENNRILYLRLLYDWPALKSMVRICPGSSTNSFKLNDLFNLLDMHGPLGFGVRAPVPLEGGEQFFDARRLIGATNALRMLLGASFYMDYQECIRSKGDVLGQYLGFASCLGRRLQRQGMDIARKNPCLDLPDFYQGDVAFVSLNYDPIALWVQSIANRDLNKSASVPQIESVPLQLFHDFGHLIPARRIEKLEADWPWYPMNEAVAQRLNEPRVSASRVRLTKFLFPHGCLCWRECPDCGKLSSYHADEWKLDASGLFPPPPLKAFDTSVCSNRMPVNERAQRDKGIIDARACLHCGTLTYAYHTQTVMQSSFKSQPPSFIEEIQRDLRAVAMQANHIILMGYSLPPDDVTYRAFFSARCQRNTGTAADPVRCTVVNLDKTNPGWYGPAKLANRNPRRCETAKVGGETVQAAQDIFGEDNVRFYGGGVPNVFLDGSVATDAALERLLDWSSVL
jgi:hypothetical protein